MTFKTATAILFSFCCCLFTLAQDKDNNQDKGQPEHPAEPTITFDRYWEAATPQEYVVTVKSSGEARYVSRSPTRIEKGEQEADPDYVVEFTMAPSDRDRIFTDAKGANYFQGEFDYKHKVADTGKKTLTYADQVRNFQTTFNFSENRDVSEIAKLFSGISLVIEHGRKLEFLRRFDKLGLEDELKGMEDMANSGYLAEIEIIAPILKTIANDNSVLHLARERAKRLLALAGNS